MASIKELKNRIKSIKSTRKITKAMQMVSAAKMRKAQTAALNSRTYSDLAWELISNLIGGTNEGDNTTHGGLYNKKNSAQLQEGVASLMQNYPNAKKTGIILISTNKGLVGSFNTNLFNKLRQFDGAEFVAELLVMGKKAKDFSLRFNKNLKADFIKNESWVGIDHIYPLAKMVADLYQSGEYKQIFIVYSHFVSTLTQQATVKQLLPFIDKGQKSAGSQTNKGYLFEPTPEFVLKNLLPRIIESQIYQAVLESDASEHSARMVMMKNATEAAGDLIDDYTLTYNQLRQNKITTELAEITAGKIALE